MYTKQERRDYQNQYRANKRAYLLEMLGKVCVVCGTEEIIEFDHIDPSTKLFTIASGLDKPLGILIEEAVKCQLLCKEHHIQKTAKELAGRIPANKGKTTHGSTMYNRGCRCDICLVFRDKKNARRRKS